MDAQLKEYLAKSKVNYKVHKHPAVFTVAESKNIEAIQKIPGIRSKNLFLSDENCNFYLVCMPGEKRLNIRALEKTLGVKKLNFASSKDLKSELNLTPGSVSIFAMINAKNTKLILDKEIWDAEITGFHPNINTATLEIQHKDLEKFINSLKCAKEILKLE
jgi:Ala-tRNA(Pro) deacylase